MKTKMVMATMALLMAFCVTQFNAWTYDEEEMKIIQDLENAELEDVDLDDIFDDSDEIGHARSIKDTLKKIGDKCKCEGLKCSCCGTPKIAGLSFDACVNMTMYPTEKIIEIGAGAAGTNMFKNISVSKLERVCDRLPGFLKKFKLCMYNNWNEATDDQSLTACTSIDATYSNTTIATIQFHCLELKDGQLSFVAPPDSTGRSAIMSLKMKNPIKTLFKLIKSKINGGDDKAE